tara:strand:- start:602 stop:1273 length:672 start_codon:yes stop_codon:yes gene_type:complete
MKAIILAAGIGSRLGKSKPKTLTKIKTGETILGRQIKYLTNEIGEKNIIIVVGYKKELIMDRYPSINYVYNPFFKNTNTAKSLLSALKNNSDSDIIWLNGDVVFDSKILKPLIECNDSCMLVNTNSVSEEEVKYNLNKDGSIKQVSKNINDGLGEAVGINKVLKKHINKFIYALEQCKDQDYFEYALELLIKKNISIYPLDILSNLCIEVDFQEDLDSLNNKL